MGTSYSADDIALQSFKFGAKSITLTYRDAPMPFDWPEGDCKFETVPLLESVYGKKAYFIDGTSKHIDTIIMCTGY